MDFHGFLEKQEGIYAKFRDNSKLKSEGTSPKIPSYNGGYLVAFRHPGEVAEKVEQFSQRVNNTVPSIIYTAKNTHTTISDMNVSEDFSPDSLVLDSLADLVQETRGKIQIPVIDYREWLANQNTVIVAGIPDESFFNTSQYMIEEAIRRGIQLKMPWGAHITAGRFKEQTKKLEELLKVLSSEPLGRSIPFAIDVGYFDFTKEGFEYKVHKRLEL